MATDLQDPTQEGGAQEMTTTEERVISSTERTELRRLIRASMKLRRSEVKTRNLEMMAAIEKTLRKEVVDDQADVAKFKARLQAFTDITNNKIAKLVSEYPQLFGEEGRWEKVSNVTPPWLHTRYDKGEDRRRQAAVAAVRAKVAGAFAEIDRLELELLKEVASTALIGEAARALAASIPTLDDVLSLAPPE